MKRFAFALRRAPLLLLFSLAVFPISGCGSSGNTVIEPGDGVMNEQEMQDYNEQMAEKDANYEDRYK